jgi:hypothetical protein
MPSGFCLPGAKGGKSTLDLAWPLGYIFRSDVLSLVLLVPFVPLVLLVP